MLSALCLSTTKKGTRLKVKTLLVLGLVLAAAAVIFNQAVGFKDAYESLSSDGSSAGSGKAGPAGGQGFVSSIHRPSAVVWAVGDGVTDSREAARVAQMIADGDVDRLLYLGATSTPREPPMTSRPTMSRPTVLWQP